MQPTTTTTATISPQERTTRQGYSPNYAAVELIIFAAGLVGPASRLGVLSDQLPPKLDPTYFGSIEDVVREGRGRANAGR